MNKANIVQVFGTGADVTSGCSNISPADRKPPSRLKVAPLMWLASSEPTSPIYGFGLSELRLGAALRELPKGEAVVSTKVGRVLVPDAGPHPFRKMFIDAGPFRPEYDYSYDGVMRSWEHSQQRLGLHKVDILYMHDISRETHGDAYEAHFRIAMEGGYRAMDDLRRSGDVRAIGLGVNEWECCMEAMDHGAWDVFLVASRFTLLEQGPLDSFLPRCTREGASVVIGAPFNSGILVRGPVEGATYGYERANPEMLDRIRKIDAICRAHRVSLASAALHFPLTHQSVVSVIPGMASVDQVAFNAARMAEPVLAALWADLRGAGLLHPDAAASALAS